MQFSGRAMMTGTSCRLPGLSSTKAPALTSAVLQWRWAIALRAILLVHRCAVNAWQGFDKKTSPELFRILLEAGANPNVRNRQGDIPLALAISVFRENSDPSAFSLEPIRLLLDAGADVNATDEDGSTALHSVFADMYYNVSLMMAAMLVWRGAQADVKNNSGITPAEAWSFEGGWRDAIRESAQVEGESSENWPFPHGVEGVVNLSPLIAAYYSLMVALSTVGKPKGSGAKAGERPGM